MTSIPGHSKPTVILVEEENGVREALTSHLRLEGFEVIGAAETDEVSALLQAHPEIRSIVADAHVPGRVDGFELLALLRRDRPDLALVMTSGHSDETSGALPEGVAFVNKPNLLEQLAPTLRRLLGSVR